MHKLIITLFNILLFTTPLLITPWTKELFEFPKIIFVYLLTIWIVVLFAIKQIVTKTNILKKTSKNVLYILSAFVAVYLLTTIFSVDLHTSIFGYYGRFNGGLLSVLCFVSLFFVAIHEYNTKKEVENTITWIVLSGAAVSIWGILQHFGVDKNMWVQDSQARVFSTLGQPNWLANFLTLLIPITLWKLFYSVNKKPIFALILVANISALWFTYSLSGILGLGIAIALIPFFVKKAVLEENLKILVVVGVAIITIAVLNLGVFEQRLRDAGKNLDNQISAITAPVFAQNSELKLNLTPKRGDTASIRLIVWQGTLELIKNNLILGTGPETFAYSFLKYRPKQLNNTSEWDFLYNKAHNELLNITACTGLLGLSIYIIAIVTFANYCVKRRKSSTVSMFFAGWFGCVVSLFFGFSTVSVSLLLWVIPALVLAYEYTKKT